MSTPALPQPLPLTRRVPLALVLVPLLALLLALVVGATGAGYVRVPAGQVLRLIFAAGQSPAADNLHATVVREVRLPRVLAAAAVGGGLALSGAVFQGILMNPLADPYTLGISAGAAFGASLAIWLGIDFLGRWSVPLFAFVGALATLVAVIGLATGWGGDLSSSNLVLAGIVVAAILSAALSFVKYAADEEVALIVSWLMGSLSGRTWADLLPLGAALMLVLPLCLYLARDLNLLALGRQSAASLGVATGPVCLALLVAASLLAAVCVSVSGIIGFVGLLVPHLLRALTGPDHRRLLPAALLAGGLLLLAADTVTRTLLPQELPVGVLTALIGGPFFCYIFYRRLGIGAMA